MKLRLENGNFKITGAFDPEAKTVTIDDLPKGLSQEDFVGCVVNMGTDGLSVITDAYGSSENVVGFRFSTFAMDYDRLTGKVTVATIGTLPDEHIDPVDPGSSM